MSGYRAIAIARSNSVELSGAIAEAKCAGRDDVAFAACDLAKIQALSEFAAQMRRTYGPIHGLVNNAGLGTSGALALMQSSKILELVTLNTISPIVLTKYIVRGMMADGGGRIINVASVAASAGYSGLAVYGATKASMIGFTRSLAREVGRMGINVNAVSPGFLETEMTQGMAVDVRQAIVRRSALKRLPLVEEIADAVEFLLGPHASSITGTVLTVDAGTTA
jgi:3-oxoacyl-[acyl-carrier protein] reductase